MPNVNGNRRMGGQVCSGGAIHSRREQTCDMTVEQRRQYQLERAAAFMGVTLPEQVAKREPVSEAVVKHSHGHEKRVPVLTGRAAEKERMIQFRPQLYVTQIFAS